SAVAGAVCAKPARTLEAIRTSEMLRIATRDTRTIRSMMRILLAPLKRKGGSVLFQHHFCGLDHRGHGISSLKLHFVRTALRYVAFRGSATTACHTFSATRARGPASHYKGGPIHGSCI